MMHEQLGGIKLAGLGSLEEPKRGGGVNIQCFFSETDRAGNGAGNDHSDERKIRAVAERTSECTKSRDTVRRDAENASKPILLALRYRIPGSRDLGNAHDVVQPVNPTPTLTITVIHRPPTSSRNPVLSKHIYASSAHPQLHVGVSTLVGTPPTPTPPFSVIQISNPAACVNRFPRRATPCT